MDSAELANLDRVDRFHWFYRGKRTIVRYWIDRYVSLRSDDLLIDAGMGTGVWLVEMSSVCRVLGLDNSKESIALGRLRLEAVGGATLKTSLYDVNLPDSCATVVTILDVLEHLDDDRAALQEMIRLVRPGGILVITVPALRWLWSDWDVALGHHRRYHMDDLLRLLRQPGVETLRCAYFNTAMLPPIALIRHWRRFLAPKSSGQRAEDKVPGSILNALLYHSLAIPARWAWFRPPIGVSLLAVLRRTEGSVQL
ncbi:MAG: class I SAM-dependent methyltransferase [Pyrinomonadaceae bacterium]|nr:class I SAM-dependent methyltransferase [Pyrinomonadaceae bacterium]